MSLPISMLLKNLIKNVSSDDKNIFISGLSTNSKYIKKNYIFFAIKGNKLNGENFIKEAINKGASVIIASKKCKFVSKDIPIIKTSNIRHLLSELSSKFYKLKPKNIIAYTKDLYPLIGFLVLFAITSVTIPKAGRIKTYASGCAKNQNKCCHSKGLPPPA